MPNIRLAGAIDSNASQSRSDTSGPPGFVRDERSTLPYGTAIQIRTVRHDGGLVVLVLNGELDVTTMEAFERTLVDVLAARPTRLTFDLTECQFVSVQGYETMGRCSVQTSVEIRSTTHLAARVLALCGYECVESVVAQGPTLEDSR